MEYAPREWLTLREAVPLSTRPLQPALLHIDALTNAFGKAPEYPYKNLWSGDKANIYGNSSFVTNISATLLLLGEGGSASAQRAKGALSFLIKKDLMVVYWIWGLGLTVPRPASSTKGNVCWDIRCQRSWNVRIPSLSTTPIHPQHHTMATPVAVAVESKAPAITKYCSCRCLYLDFHVGCLHKALHPLIDTAISRPRRFDHLHYTGARLIRFRKKSQAELM